MNIKFDTDDDLPLNNPLNLRVLTVILRSVFEEGDKLYSQIYLDEFFYKL